MNIIIPGDAAATVYMPYDSSKQHLFIDGKMNSARPQNDFIIIKNVATGKHKFIMK